MIAKVKVLSAKVLSNRQKQVLIEANFEVIEANFIQTTSISFSLSGVNECLVFTSQNAVRSILLHPDCEALKNKKVFCVGLKTKILLSEAGFEVVAYSDYAEDLSEIITLIYANETYTFFSGNLRREALPQALKNAKIVLNEIEVYTTELTPKKIQEKADVLLFFSPSGIESYLKENKIKDEICFCIGKTTAEALEKTTKNIIIANHPSIENVIEDVIEEYN